MDEYYQLADYILNHYDRNSHSDKLALANDLKKRMNNRYNNGLDTAIALIKDDRLFEVTLAGWAQTVLCGLESSKI